MSFNPVKRKYKPRGTVSQAELKKNPQYLNLIAPNKTFGKLLVMISDNEYQCSTIGLTEIISCKCICGADVHVECSKLANGVVDSCPSCAPWSNPSEDDLAKYAAYAKAVGCNLGIAASYITNKVPLKRAKLQFGRYLTGIKDRIMRSDFRRSRVKIKHFQVSKIDARHSIVNGAKIIYDRLDCECGRIIYVDQCDLEIPKLPECHCDAFHKQLSAIIPTLGEHFVTKFQDELAKVSSRRSKLGPKGPRPKPERDEDEDDDFPPTVGFDFTPCQTGPDQTGLCAKYCNDDGCLMDAALGRYPHHFEKGYTCYTKPYQKMSADYLRLLSSRVIK